MFLFSVSLLDSIVIINPFGVREGVFHVQINNICPIMLFGRCGGRVWASVYAGRQCPLGSSSQHALQSLIFTIIIFIKQCY